MRVTKDFLIKENAELRQKLKSIEENHEDTRRAIAGTLELFDEIKYFETPLEKTIPVTWIDIGCAIGKLLERARHGNS